MQSIHTLFRRTVFALGAIAALTGTGIASAQSGTITLSGGTASSGSCEYTNMSISPDGGVEVTCKSSSGGGSAATFALAAAVSSLSTGGSASNAFRVTKGGTGVDTVVLDVTTSSPANVCTLNTTSVSFSVGGSTTQNVSVTPGSAEGVCTVQIQVASGTGTVTASGAEKSVPVSAPVAGCPASSITPKSLGGAGVTQNLAMADGGIAAFTLPAPINGRVTGVFKLSFTPSSTPVAVPQPWSYEISISKCKGEIDPGAGVCYKMVRNATEIGSVKWLHTNSDPRYPPATLEARGWCPAVKEEGTWYANVRYNVPQSCTDGSKPIMCAWYAQWTNSSY